MNAILDSKNQPTRLLPGDVIVYLTQEKCLMLYRDDGNNLSALSWANGDQKKLVYFIRREDDFFSLAQILGETHGLDIKEDNIRFKEPVWVFVIK
jgi:hypothetical protein